MQDYPSPGEIRQLLIDNNVTPVFGVTESALTYYQKLSSMFVNVGAQVVEISGDSSNVVSAIQTGYEVMSETCISNRVF